LLESGVDIVQIGLFLAVDHRPVFGRLPMEEVLPPAHLLAGDVEATQRADDGDGENERALAHERLE
jgi:hypothetical protein